MDHIYERKLTRPKSSKRTGSIFQTAKRFQQAPFRRNGPPKGGVYNSCGLRSYVRSVGHELCHLNIISNLSIVDIIVLGAKYHLSCLAVLVNCMQQRNNGKVLKKDREKRNCKSITLASTLAEFIYHEQNSRTRQPRTTGSSRTREVIFAKCVAAEKQ